MNTNGQELAAYVKKNVTEDGRVQTNATYAFLRDLRAFAERVENTRSLDSLRSRYTSKDISDVRKEVIDELENLSLAGHESLLINSHKGDDGIDDDVERLAYRAIEEIIELMRVDNKRDGKIEAGDAMAYLAALVRKMGVFR